LRIGLKSRRIGQQDAFCQRPGSVVVKPKLLSVSTKRAHHVVHAAFVALLVGGLSTGCTQIELETKAEAYNAAIAESNNEAILLNAVRASQLAPMSFVSLGQVLSTPTLSGIAPPTFNFDTIIRGGLTTYTLAPTANVAGGFQSFTMDNLNSSDFMDRMRKPIKPELIRYFHDSLGWPQELMELLFIAQVKVKPGVRDWIERTAIAKCAGPPDEPRTEQICAAIRQVTNERQLAGCYERPDGGLIFNSARNICKMAKFQIFIRMSRLLRIDIFRRFEIVPHTSLGMLYYLGELIAAQNYSESPYMPRVLFGTSTAGDILVPLFVVRHGLHPPGVSAVHVSYHGEIFYIPQPNLGAADEARSLQVLDFVSQVISAQTLDKNIPRINAITTVNPAR
jgi:hypothetical protein